MKLQFYGHILEKYIKIKFYENPSSGSLFVPCGRTNKDTFRTAAHASNNSASPILTGCSVKVQESTHIILHRQQYAL